MKAAFAYDAGNQDGTIGGAELTMLGFAADAPVELTSVEEADVVVVGNCTSFGPELIGRLRGKRVVRYHNDLARHEHPELRSWLERNATHIFTSPMHQAKYGLEGVWPNVPPALDLDSFKPPRQSRKRRKGTCSIACWQNPGKGANELFEWAQTNGEVDVYGTGEFVPNLNLKGPVEPGQVAQTLWRYERFVFLPSAPEPFGRCTVEAWAAGCKVVVNGNVGALHYIRREAHKLESAHEDFWGIVCG